MSLHISLELNIILVHSLVKGSPVFRELRKAPKIIGFWISLKDLLEHIISAFNFGIDEFWINFLVDQLLLFGKCVF